MGGAILPLSHILSLMLSRIKTILSIDCTDDDILLQSLLDIAMDTVNRVLYDVEYWEKEILVKTNSIHYNTIWLPHLNPTKITEVNGEDWSGKSNWVDYLILDNGEVKMWPFNKDSMFWAIKVKYMAGYHLKWQDYDLPESLLWAIAMYVGHLYSLEDGRTVKRLTTWPRSVEYATASWDNSKDIWNAIFVKSLSYFIPLHLRVW